MRDEPALQFPRNLTLIPGDVRLRFLHAEPCSYAISAERGEAIGKLAGVFPTVIR